MKPRLGSQARATSSFGACRGSGREGGDLNGRGPTPIRGHLTRAPFPATAVAGSEGGHRWHGDRPTYRWLLAKPHVRAKGVDGGAAVAAHAAGHVAWAEQLAREAVQINPGDAVAWNLLGRIALDLGRPDAAVGLLEQSTAADPRFKPAAKNLATARRLVDQPQPPQADHASDAERFLLIKGWGYGFWADVDHVMGQLLVAEWTGRTPVVHWGEESLWHDDSLGPRGDAWRQFFEPVSDRTIDDVLRAAVRAGASGGKPAIWPPKWTADTLLAREVNKFEGPHSRCSGLLTFGRSEPVVVSDFHTGVVGLLPWAPIGGAGLLRGADYRTAHRELFARYLKPRAEVLAEVDAWAREHLPEPERTIAVHVRGTDKVVETAHLHSVNEEYPARIDALLARAGDLRIFLLTDDAVTRQRFIARYGQRVLTTDAQRASGTTGVHYLPSALPSGLHGAGGVAGGVTVGRDRDGPRTRLGAEVLKDVLLAARCRCFVGLGSSNVSCAVLHMKAWRDEDVSLADVVLHSYLSPILLRPR